MLDQLLNSAKGELLSQLQGKFDLNEGKAEEAAKVTKDTIESGLLSEVKAGNIGGLLSMFDKKTDTTSSPIVQTIVQQLVGNLAAKVGVDAGTASTIANFAVPFLIDKVTGSAPGGQVTESNLQDMVTDGIKDQLADKAKDLLGGGLGSFFGK